MDAGDSVIVFVAMSLFANLFDRESGFDDAFVFAHASLHLWKIWNYTNMKIIIA